MNANKMRRGGQRETRPMVARVEDDRLCRKGVKLGQTSASPVIATMPPDNVGSYPGQGLSLSQLLYAAKRMLQDATLGGRYARDFMPYYASRTKSLKRKPRPEPRRP